MQVLRLCVGGVRCPTLRPKKTNFPDEGKRNKTHKMHRSESAFATPARSLPTTFGRQISSRRNSSPAFGFGSTTHQLTRMRTRLDFSEEPVVGTLGYQRSAESLALAALAQHGTAFSGLSSCAPPTSAPLSRRTKPQADPWAYCKPNDTPGPGSYDPSRGQSVGSRMATSPRVSAPVIRRVRRKWIADCLPPCVVGLPMAGVYDMVCGSSRAQL